MLPIPLAVQIKKSNKCHVQAILRSVHRTALFSWNDVERGGNPHGVMVGVCPTQSKGGDGRLNKVSKGSGPYHCCPFPRRIPSSSCFCSEWSHAVQWMQSKGEETLFFHNSRDIYYHKPFGKTLAHAMIRFSSAIYGNHGVADQTKNTL